MKRRVFTLFAALFSMTVMTACGVQRGPESVEPCPKNAHQWVKDDSKTDVAATCTQEGIKYEICSVCGETRETKVNKAAHTWGNWVAKSGGAYCGPDEEEHECSVCHTKESRVGAIIQHTWEKTGEVAEGDGGVAYDLIKCSVCQKTGLMVAASQATLSEGASKKTAPEGCVKLSPDGSYMTLDIKLEEAKTGTLFLRGSMDYWYASSNQNEQKTYYDENNGHTNKENGVGNFKVEVGPKEGALAEVQLPANKDLTYGDMLPEEVGFEDIGSTTWSQIGDCIVGAVSLVQGLNTIKFTRIDSYNLSVHDFVVVFDTAA